MVWVIMYLIIYNKLSKLKQNNNKFNGPGYKYKHQEKIQYKFYTYYVLCTLKYSMTLKNI